MDERTITTQLVFRCPVFSVHESLVQTEQSKEEKRWVIERPSSVSILVTDDRHRVLVVNQFRTGSGTSEWRLPTGTLKSGESFEVAASRELFEETGLWAADFDLLELSTGRSGWIKEESAILLAKGCEERGAPQAHEPMLRRWLNRSELGKLVYNFEFAPHISRVLVRHVLGDRYDNG